MIMPQADSPTAGFRPFFNPATGEWITYTATAEDTGGQLVRFTWRSVPRFAEAEFSGGTVDFSDPWDWSFPPEFPWTDAPPPGVNLPKKEDQSQA
jgi:hypothetical protein